MQTGILDLKKFISKKDRRIILREEKLKKKREKKREKPVEVRKIERKEEVLREMTVKISLERINIQK